MGFRMKIVGIYKAEITTGEKNMAEATFPFSASHPQSQHT
jgi:hypothetical protein